jgi:hypothetical protein
MKQNNIFQMEDLNMKKNSVWLIVALIAAVVVEGCGSAPATTATAAPALTAPDWADELPPEDAFWGIGIAKLQNESLAQQAATSRARRAVAEQLSVLVKGMLTDYAREAGTLSDSTSIQLVESVGRDLVSNQLSGAAPNARKRMPDGTWWVRVSLPKADAKKAATSAIDSEAARFADFKAQEALKMMDAQLDKANPKPLVRSED